MQQVQEKKKFEFVETVSFYRVIDSSVGYATKIGLYITGWRNFS